MKNVLIAFLLLSACQLVYAQNKYVPQWQKGTYKRDTGAAAQPGSTQKAGSSLDQAIETQVLTAEQQREQSQKKKEVAYANKHPNQGITRDPEKEEVYMNGERYVCVYAGCMQFGSQETGVYREYINPNNGNMIQVDQSHNATSLTQKGFAAQTEESSWLVKDPPATVYGHDKQYTKRNAPTGKADFTRVRVYNTDSKGVRTSVDEAHDQANQRALHNTDLNTFANLDPNFTR